MVVDTFYFKLYDITINRYGSYSFQCIFTFSCHSWRVDIYGEILQYRGGEWNGDTKSVQIKDGRVKKVPHGPGTFTKKRRGVVETWTAFFFQGVPEGMWVEKVEGIPRTINFGRSRKRTTTPAERTPGAKSKGDPITDENAPSQLTPAKKRVKRTRKSPLAMLKIARLRLRLRLIKSNLLCHK